MSKHKRRLPSLRITRARILHGQPRGFDHKAILYTFVVDGHEVRRIHWSGKWSGSARAFARHLKMLARKYDAHYITTTETRRPKFRRQLRKRLGRTWGIQRAGEYLLIFNRDTFTPIDRLEPHVKTMTNVPRWAFWRQMHVGVFNLRHIATGRRFRILVVHGPSGIQSGDNFKRGKATAVAQQGWPKLGRNMARFARRRPMGVQDLAGDDNADKRRPVWLDRLERYLGTPSVWRNQMPDGGTHAGGRLIDGGWVYGADPYDKKAA